MCCYIVEELLGVLQVAENFSLYWFDYNYYLIIVNLGKYLGTSPLP